MEIDLVALRLRSSLSGHATLTGDLAAPSRTVIRVESSEVTARTRAHWGAPMDQEWVKHAVSTRYLSNVLST
jgi:hypothetical protein